MALQFYTDYDDEGNNIIPCPICNDKWCPSKQEKSPTDCSECGNKYSYFSKCAVGGFHPPSPRCPQEDEYIKWLDARENRIKLFLYKTKRVIYRIATHIYDLQIPLVRVLADKIRDIAREE